MWRSQTQDEQSLLVWFALAIIGACLALVGWLRAIV
jgi:hypothetical protein